MTEGTRDLDVAVRYIREGREGWLRVRGKVVEFADSGAPLRAVGTARTSRPIARPNIRFA